MYEVDEKKFRILIEALKKREPEKFDFAAVVADYEVQKGGNICGTVCCVIGMTPEIFPDDVQWTHYENNTGIALAMSGYRMGFHKVAEKLFGIKSTIASFLFTPKWQIGIHPELPFCAYDASPLEVAEMMEKFLELVKDGKIEGHKIK